MRILIIGGTAFIGPYVAEILNDMGHELTLFHRNPVKSPVFPKVNHILGDRKNLSDFKDEFRDFSPEAVLDMILLFEKDAKTLMDTFRGISKRVIAVSSQDVYRAYGKFIGTEKDGPENYPLKEESPLRDKLYPYKGKNMGMDDYDKIPVEHIVMNDEDLAGTILRLPMVYGPGDRQHRLFNFLKLMDDKRPAILLQEGFDEWRWTRGYVENVALAIVSAILSESASGEIYNVGQENSFSMKEWIEEIGRLIGWNGKVVAVSEDMMPEQLRMEGNTKYSLVTDTGKIRRDLAFKEKVSFDEGLKRTVEWERANPPHNINQLQFDYELQDDILEKIMRAKHS